MRGRLVHCSNTGRRLQALRWRLKGTVQAVSSSASHLCRHRLRVGARGRQRPLAHRHALHPPVAAAADAGGQLAGAGATGGEPTTASFVPLSLDAVTTAFQRTCLSGRLRAVHPLARTDASCHDGQTASIHGSSAIAPLRPLFLLSPPYSPPITLLF